MAGAVPVWPGMRALFKATARRDMEGPPPRASASVGRVGTTAGVGEHVPSAFLSLAAKQRHHNKQKHKHKHEHDDERRGASLPVNPSARLLPTRGIDPNDVRGDDVGGAGSGTLYRDAPPARDRLGNPLVTATTAPPRHNHRRKSNALIPSPPPLHQSIGPLRSSSLSRLGGGKGGGSGRSKGSGSSDGGGDSLRGRSGGGSGGGFGGKGDSWRRKESASVPRNMHASSSARRMAMQQH